VSVRRAPDAAKKKTAADTNDVGRGRSPAAAVLAFDAALHGTANLDCGWRVNETLNCKGGSGTGSAEVKDPFPRAAPGSQSKEAAR
jgi:hypothetical protein